MSLILASIFDGNIKTKNEEEERAGGREGGWLSECQDEWRMNRHNSP